MRWLCFILLLFPQIVYAQNSQVEVEISEPWGNISGLCLERGGCWMLPRVDAEGTLYQVIGRWLYLIAPHGEVITTYDIRAWDLPILRGEAGFELVDTDTLVFRIASRSNVAPIAFVDFTEGIVTSPASIIPRLAVCTFSQTFHDVEGVPRLGDSNYILLCSRNSFYIVDMFTGELIWEHNFNYSPEHPAFRAWMVVRPGQDGNVYLLAWHGEPSFHQLFPEVEAENYVDSLLLMRYDVAADEWTFLAFNHETIGVSASCSVMSWWFEVDRFGDSYVQYWCSHGSSIALRMSKFDAAGDLLWQLDGQDFGGTPLSITVLEADRFLIQTIERNVQLVEINP